MGSGKTQPSAWLLHMPVGVVLGATALVYGLGSGALAAKTFSEGNSVWKRYFLTAFCAFLLEGLCSVTCWGKPKNRGTTEIFYGIPLKEYNIVIMVKIYPRYLDFSPVTV